MSAAVWQPICLAISTTFGWSYSRHSGRHWWGLTTTEPANHHTHFNFHGSPFCSTSVQDHISGYPLYLVVNKSNATPPHRHYRICVYVFVSNCLSPACIADGTPLLSAFHTCCNYLNQAVAPTLSRGPASVNSVSLFQELSLI